MTTMRYRKQYLVRQQSRALTIKKFESLCDGSFFTNAMKKMAENTARVLQDYKKVVGAVAAFSIADHKEQ